ncbi:MAG: hypothetical protein ACK4ZS_04710 [Sulfurimicrobium sp.]
MLYLLDTNIVIAALKGMASVRRKLETTPVSSLVLSPVVLGELEFGADKSPYPEKTAPGWPSSAKNFPSFPWISQPVNITDAYAHNWNATAHP